jgi:hypothetical protein
MTYGVQQSPFVTATYSLIGMPSVRNPWRIFLLPFPEFPSLATRGYPWPTLGKEFSAR